MRMRQTAKKSILIGFIWFLMAGLSSAKEQFPLPRVLEPNVQFWTQIYSHYSVDEVVLHDRDDLGVIYEVLKFDSSSVKSTQERWQIVRETRKKYQTLLNRLARVSSIDIGTLNPEERRVYELWQHVSTPHRFRAAARNIRAQKGLKEQFRSGLIRSGRYLKEIRSILNRYDVPEELAYLPHVESSFNTHAYSKLGAAGMWQFTRSTGRLFLSIGYSIDERLDPIMATEAAAKLLKKNYSELQSWPLAITAYNHGFYGMKRAKRRLGTSDMGQIVLRYKSRSFGFASKNFYSEFLAAKQIASNFRYYFGDLQLDSPAETERFTLPDYVTFESLLKIFDVSREELTRLNPSLRTPILSSKRRIPRGYELRLPGAKDVSWSSLYAQNMPSSERHGDQVREQYYKVRHGDNLSAIARRFRTSTRALMAMNDIRNPHRIHVGDILELPGGQPAPQSEKVDASSPLEQVLGGGVKPEPEELEPEQERYAALMGPLPPPQTEAVSAQTHSQPITPQWAPPDSGWNFAFSAKAPSSSDPWVNVHPEETLGHYADWLQVRTQQLRTLNGFAFGQQLHIGQPVKLSFLNISPREFHRRRLEYHRSIQEDFYSGYRVEGVQSYRIKQGDSVWSLTHHVFEIPAWLLQKYNPQHELSQLYPGDTIQVPVITPIEPNTMTSVSE